MLLEVARVQTPDFGALTPLQPTEFFKGRHAARITLLLLGPGLAKPEAHVVEHPLALVDADGHPVVVLQMLRALNRSGILAKKCSTIKDAMFSVDGLEQMRRFDVWQNKKFILTW